MKPLLFIITFFITTITVAQQDTLYFNKDWELCNIDKAEYYRIAQKQEAGGYIIQDTYLKTNIPQMIALSATVEPTYFIGKCTYYYPNGKKSSEGYYLDDEKTGLWRDYTENGKDSTLQDFGIPKKKKLNFIPQDISKEQKIKDSIIVFNSQKHSAWEPSTSQLQKDKQAFAFSVRGKVASFFIIEDVYFVTYTLGTEFAYKRHSLGLDYTWFRWRYESDNNDDVGMYSQYELRTYLHADYKYTFLEFQRAEVDIYFNAYDKIGNYSMWYDKYTDYDFGTRDMSFLQSTAKGTFNEPGAGFGIRKYAEKSGFGIDISANAGYRMTNNDEINYEGAGVISYRNDVKEDRYLFYMRINCFYNFGR